MVTLIAAKKPQHNILSFTDSKHTGRYNYERSNQELLKEEVKRLNNVMLSFFSLSSSWMRPCATKVHAAINCLGKGYIDKNLHKVFSQLFGSERATWIRSSLSFPGCLWLFLHQRLKEVTSLVQTVLLSSQLRRAAWLSWNFGESLLSRWKWPCCQHPIRGLAT